MAILPELKEIMYDIINPSCMHINKLRLVLNCERGYNYQYWSDCL